MTMRLTTNDYKHILEFYNKSLPKSKTLIRLKAKKIITRKLCRCIKKFDKKVEARSIGICTRSIINNKGFTRGKFRCKKKQNIQLFKNKTRKNK
jgi:hypothetical protein